MKIVVIHAQVQQCDALDAVKHQPAGGEVGSAQLPLACLEHCTYSALWLALDLIDLCPVQRALQSIAFLDIASPPAWRASLRGAIQRLINSLAVWLVSLLAACLQKTPDVVSLGVVLGLASLLAAGMGCNVSLLVASPRRWMRGVQCGLQLGQPDADVRTTFCLSTDRLNLSKRPMLPGNSFVLCAAHATPDAFVQH